MNIQFFPDPSIIVQIGSVPIYFYGAMYALSAVLGYFLVRYIAKKRNLHISNETLLDFVFWAFLGGVIGGRIFYIVVYNFEYFVHNPWSIFAVWQGGMSIHGGLLGGALAAIFFLKKKNIPVWNMAGVVPPAIALGMMLGRIANFMNKELIGRVADVSWAINFGDGIMRHPSQLYAAGKDAILFLLFFFLCQNTKIGGKRLFGGFLIVYGIFRFFVEFFREPDPQIGFPVGIFSLGQILSVLVILVGAWIFYISEKRGKKSKKVV